MDKQIFVVDDEPDILELLNYNLTRSGYKVKAFANAKPFFMALDRQVPILIILDLMLPDMDGIEICKRIKGEKRLAGIPVIMLTARAEETDKILGLELGADDYVTKPFSPKELIARVKAVLRRNTADVPKKRIEVGGDIAMDLERYQVTVRAKPVELTQTEFNILKILSSNPGRVYSRDEILDHLWGHEKVVIDRTVDVHIKHLREKLGKSGQMIKNVRGVGYKIEDAH